MKSQYSDGSVRIIRRGNNGTNDDDSFVDDSSGSNYTNTSIKIKSQYTSSQQ